MPSARAGEELQSLIEEISLGLTYRLAQFPYGGIVVQGFQPCCPSMPSDRYS
jgi:hypothetical protein